MSLYHGQISNGVKILVVNDAYYYYPTGGSDQFFAPPPTETCYDFLKCCETLHDPRVQDTIRPQIKKRLQGALNRYNRECKTKEGLPKPPFRGSGYQIYTNSQLDIDRHLTMAKHVLQKHGKLLKWREKCLANARENPDYTYEEERFSPASLAVEVEEKAKFHVRLHQVVYFLKRFRWKLKELHKEAPDHHQPQEEVSHEDAHEEA